jgi:hypothetical protein
VPAGAAKAAAGPARGGGDGGDRACAGRRRLRAPGYHHDAACSDMVAVGSTVYLVDERKKLWHAELAALKSGAVLFARQTLDPLLVSSTVRDQQWFWLESLVDAGVDDLIVLKKTVPHWPGAFTANDSFWFFLSIDRGQ